MRSAALPLLPRVRLEDARVAVVGVGGLGCPVIEGLATAGVGHLTLIDDDVVELTNLHRQLLYGDADVGSSKLEAARRAVQRLSGGRTHVTLVEGRWLPDTARALAQGVHLVIEGADNFATKFLAADACRLERRALVQGSAVRWVGTALATAPEGAPCYRCLFEDIPDGGAQETCTGAGVLGPVVGFIGALMLELSLRVLDGDGSACGLLYDYDGWRDRLRQVELKARPDCPLCGEGATITATPERQYLPATSP